MKKILCKKCPQCGLFNDFTIEECDCGKKLNSVEAKFIDRHEIPNGLYGEIDTSLDVYVQKCSACGALNYTDSPAHPVKVCCNCHKTRIAAIKPVKYVEEDSEKTQDTSTPEVSEPGAVSSHIEQRIKDPVPQGKQQPYVDDDDDDDDDDESAKWKGILGNTQKAAGSAPKASQLKSDQQNTHQPAGQNATQMPSDDDDDDDDADGGDWSDILGTKSTKKEITIKNDITLTAIRYGRLSFTIEAGQDTYMLGRSAKQGNFLSQDGQVGNEHCYLFCRNGAWFVRDNNSKNGTFVNSQDIGQNGECMLSDGDELKLGHRPDSVAFRITIN